ncbi:MAG: DUF3489 domain-containing protein [Terriglobia bacterium]
MVNGITQSFQAKITSCKSYLFTLSKGATLPEIVAATGWQKHTVRGFVSILESKGGEKIESSKNASGDRTYTIAG